MKNFGMDRNTGNGRVLSRHGETNDGGIDEGDGASNY